MANLKELRSKIHGIQSIRKVTSAMQLVAGVKLKKAERRALSSKSYAEELRKMLAEIDRDNLEKRYELFDGRFPVKTETFIVFASDKGFCGGFNYTMNKKVLEIAKERNKSGINVKILCVGLKVFTILKHSIAEPNSIELIGDFYRGDALFANSKKLADRVIEEFNNGNVDKVSLLFTCYQSASKTSVAESTLIPLPPQERVDRTITVFEPDADRLLSHLLPYNLGIQIYQAALESVASEQSARMTSMDNSTRNATDMLADLTIRYNRTRQYGITQELTEVVSGAEAISNK